MPRGAELDGVEVRHHERDHSREQDVLLPPREPRGLEPHAAEQEITPLVQREVRTALDESVERIAGRHLDRPHGFDAERLPARLAGQRGDVLEGDLGVEAAGEHPVVLVHELIGDVDVVELEARQLGLVGVGTCIEPRTQ